MKSAAPRAAIVAIGEELLEGRVLDTNSRFFAAELLRLGVAAARMQTIGDAAGALAELLGELARRYDLILTTGGLGPTADDRVRREVAELLGEPLVEVDGALEPLAALYWRQHGCAPPPWFLAQGMVPRGAQPLRNRAGTAWGFACELDGARRLICLPGPPLEAKSCFFDGGALADLQRRYTAAGRAVLGVFHTAGAVESAVEAQIRDLLEGSVNPRFGIIASERQVTISIMAYSEGGERRPEELLESAGAELRRRLGDLLWGRDEDTLESVVVKKLALEKQRVAVAESCTGGRLAAALTAVPGASEVFGWGWVAYANEAKVQELGVAEELLARHGAVSVETALAMAEGARRRAGADFGISTTGVAGPGGGSAAKPVGLVYLGVAGPRGGYVVRRRQYDRGGRHLIQESAVRDALEALRRELFGLPRLAERD